MPKYEELNIEGLYRRAQALLADFMKLEAKDYQDVINYGDTDRIFNEIADNLAEAADALGLMEEK